MLENAVAEVLARRIHPMRQFVACRSATNCLAGLCQAGECGRQLLMSRRAGNGLVRASQSCQSCRQIDAGSVDIDPVAPRHRGVNAGAKVEMLIFRDADVMISNRPVHLGCGIDGV